MKKLIMFMLFLLMGSISLGSAFAYDYESVDFVNLYIDTKNFGDIDKKRNDIINWVWKDGISNLTPSITQDVSNTITNYIMSDVSHIEQINKIEFTKDSFTYDMYLFIPKAEYDNNRLFIFSPGHDENEAGTNAMVQALINEGYYVLLRYMPCVATNTAPVTGTGTTCHNNFNSLESGSYNPMEAFFNDLYSGVSYLDNIYNFDDISMAGISGGGWTTVWYSAIDERVINSYPVAGSYPRFIYDEVMVGAGDYEQGSDLDVYNFLTTNTSELDMYILGASNGRQLAIHNLNDACCFAGTHSNFYTPYINYQVKMFGGSYDNYITSSSNHEITSDARNLIINTNNELYTKTYHNYIKVNINAENRITSNTIVHLGYSFSTSEQIINWLNIMWGNL